MISEGTLIRALSPDILELIILPTEKCNFRCTYCYEDYVIGRMPPGIVTGIKRLISNRAKNLKSLSISWFGGEPLLAKDVVLDIGSHAFRECEENNVSFSSGFTTNGYLLERGLLERLIEIKHTAFQITLDGDEEWHNKTRIQPNRKPTFERIWGNLLLLKESTGLLDVNLRLHVHKHNIESVKRLYSRIKSEFGGDSRFRVYFHKISPLGGVNNAKIAEDVLDNASYAEALSYISGSYAKESNKPISEIHLDGYICYAAKPNSLMIRANGGIGKCTVALGDPRNDIGKIREDGTLDISNPKLQKWFAGYADLSEKTLGCPLSTLRSAEQLRA